MTILFCRAVQQTRDNHIKFFFHLLTGKAALRLEFASPSTYSKYGVKKCEYAYRGGGGRLPATGKISLTTDLWLIPGIG